MVKKAIKITTWFSGFHQITLLWISSSEIINRRTWLIFWEQFFLLRTFTPIVTAHRYCARKFTQHVMHRIWTMIGKMAIAIALRGFNGLGRLVTPTFLSRNRFHLPLSSTHCPKMTKNWTWEIKKKIKISVHRTSNPAILRLQGAWNYGSLKQYLAENVSL